MLAKLSKFIFTRRKFLIIIFTTICFSNPNAKNKQFYTGNEWGFYPINLVGKNWKKYSKLPFVFPSKISKSNIRMCVCVQFTRKFRSPTQIIVLLHDNYSPQQSIHSYKSLPFPVNLSLSITNTPPNAHIRKEIRFVLHICIRALVYVNAVKQWQK